MELSWLVEPQRANVVLLERASSVRTFCMDALTRCGYTKIVAVNEPEAFESANKSTRFDWYILSLDCIREGGPVQFIANLYESTQNKQAAITILYETGEDYWLFPLLETGVFSGIVKAYSTEAIEEQFRELMALYKIWNFNSVLVSAEFARNLLRAKKCFKSLLKFEESLMELYPGLPRGLLKLGEAQCLNMQYQQAAITIAQAEFIEPSLKASANVLVQKYLKNLSADIRIDTRNVLGFKNCVVIDPDTDTQFVINECLGKLGLNDVTAFQSGNEAFEFLKSNSEPKIIIMEWNLPGLSGVALVQRIREFGFNSCHIVVVSSLVKKTEIPLLIEVGADAVLEKPFKGQALVKELVKIAQSVRSPSEKRSLERKIRVHLASGRLGEAERLIAEYFANEEIPEASKVQMKAEFYYASGNFEQACEDGLKSLKLYGGESVLLLSLLGKSFLKLKEFAEAEKCFEKAYKLSPTNVSRILSLVNMKLDQGNTYAADWLMDEAKNIDPTHHDVKQTECRLALEKSDLLAAKQLLSTLDSLTGVIGIINNSAVALIRSGKFEDGIRLYNDALKCLPIDSADVRELLSYNLGLAYARYGELERALQTFRSLEVSSGSKLYQKYTSLKQRVQRAFEKGERLEFFESLDSNSSESPSKALTLSFLDISKKLEIQRGQRFCYKLYFRVEPIEYLAEEYEKAETGQRR